MVHQEIALEKEGRQARRGGPQPTCSQNPSLEEVSNAVVYIGNGFEHMGRNVRRDEKPPRGDPECHEIRGTMELDWRSDACSPTYLSYHAAGSRFLVLPSHSIPARRSDCQELDDRYCGNDQQEQRQGHNYAWKEEAQGSLQHGGERQ
jgi:hypothetical protein